MSAQIETSVSRAADRGSRVGVLVLVDKPQHGGAAPLALKRNLDTLSERTQEVHHQARNLLLAPEARTDVPNAAARLAPLAAGRARDDRQRGPVMLENLGAVMGAVDAPNLAQLSELQGVRKVIAMPRFIPLVSPLRYQIAAPADLVDGPLDNLVQIGVPELWDQDLLGQGTRIGHFDTGINARHPALAPLRSQRRLRYAAFNANAERIPRARARDTDFGDFVHHGTHTAGTLVGNAVDGTQIGIAPRARLISVQVFPQPTPTAGQHDELVVAALNWIVGERPDVLNLSFGDIKYNDSYLGVIGELIDQNIVVVAAVGNGGVKTSSSPGNYADVIGVGAVGRNNQVAGFSSSATVRRRPRPDLCAPGMDIISAGRAEEFAVSTGTSMAAPHVAGVVALLRQRAPDLSPGQIKDLLKQSAHRPGGWDANRGGAGILDARALLSSI